MDCRTKKYGLHSAIRGLSHEEVRFTQCNPWIVARRSTVYTVQSVDCRTKKYGLHSAIRGLSHEEVRFTQCNPWIVQVHALRSTYIVYTKIM